MLKIDIHTHVIPEKLPDYSRKFGYEGFVNLVKKDDSTAIWFYLMKISEQ